VNVDQCLHLAQQHHQAGRLPQAEALYRQVLAVEPEHPDALHLLGVIACQLGRAEMGVDLIRQAVALDPSFAQAYGNLGNALKDTGRLNEAIAAFRQAILLNPTLAGAHNNLGNALRIQGQLDEAIAAFRQAIALDPGVADFRSNLGNVLSDNDLMDDAIAAYRQAIALKPEHAEAHFNLGNALRKKGDTDDAIAAYRKAIILRPRFPEAHFNLANALRDSGSLADAVAAYRQASALEANHPEAYVNLGNVLRDMGHLAEAVEVYRQGIALKPDYAEAHCNLGNALGDIGQLDEAVAAYRQAIALNPKSPGALRNLGNVLKSKGRVDEAISAYRDAMVLDPSNHEAHSNLVYALHFHPDYDAHAIGDEHRRWCEQHAQSLSRSIRPHPNDRSSGRRLKIGYVSPDFRNHVVGLNLLPLLRHHDREKFAIHCYSQVLSSDAVTDRFQQHSDGWRNIVGLSDDQAAQRIRDDRIDILVDLALHMADNRLLVFARKPAPVQVTFAGYPGSTGLRTIDYRLSDPYLDPPGMDESVYSETTLRLPESFWCYDPLDCRDIPVSPLPSRTAGAVTFGCLNNYAKINPAVLGLWAQVLRAVPSSRLLLMTAEGSHRQDALDLFAEAGVASERIEFASRRPRRQYMELYHRIDLGLDTFPYNGHTTSLDSYWMGVPVVTLVGQTAVGRAGLCQSMNLRLPELIARTTDEYVQIAVDLSRDAERLQQYRAELRERMQESPLMDAPRFARNVEAAYRDIWRKWCEGQRE
jgi:predicted O-linked N-acetylglucosamine transferase (SPINDLY family)